MPNGLERLELLISERRIRTRIAALARRIDADYRERQPSLVVVLKGAFVFAADLSRRIEVPFTLDFISASSYGACARSSGKVALGGTVGQNRNRRRSGEGCPTPRAARSVVLSPPAFSATAR